MIQADDGVLPSCYHLPGVGQPAPTTSEGLTLGKFEKKRMNDGRKGRVAEAERNLRWLAENPYPGRGIVLGRDGEGRQVQCYWIMGRSENSQNRVFLQEGTQVRTAPWEAEKLVNPRLVIYTAMAEAGGQHVVSNGDHTDVLCRVLDAGGQWQAALADCAHEPDAPHYTPRIAGALRSDGLTPAAWLAIIRADPFSAAQSRHAFYTYPVLSPGFGWGITTYAGDGEPLPSFVGEPLLLPLSGGSEGLEQWLWAHLNPDNRVALAVKIIVPQGEGSEIRIINRHG